MSYTFKNDWRQKVAAMTEPDDIDIEKTFADIASGFVANKVGDLMKDQHRIGFEVVKKNEDNTRMLGVFAFKVDKQLIFAPVFFLSGEIKGPLLYRCDAKQFLPANKDWATYLIESISTKEGRGINKSNISETAPMVAMDKIMMRPKQASDKESEQEEENERKERQFNTLAREKHKKDTAEAINDVITLESGDTNYTQEQFAERVKHYYDKKKEKEEQIDAGNCIKKAFAYEFGEDVEAGLLQAIAKSAAFKPGILKEFLSEKGYGKVAADAIIKAASEEGSEKLLEHIVSLYETADNFIPDNVCDFDKQAAVQEQKLEAHFALTNEAAQKPQQYFKDGFFMWDSRHKDKCNKVIKHPVSNKLSTITDAGQYDLLKEDGSLITDCFCGLVLPTVECCRKPGKEDCLIYRDTDTYVAAVDKDGNFGVYKKLMGINHNTTSTSKLSELPGVKEGLQKGGVYVTYVRNSSSMSAPFYVYNTKEVDGVKYYKVIFIEPASIYRSRGEDKYNRLFWDIDSYSDELCTLVVNEDLQKSDHGKGTYGKNAKFIKLNTTVTTKHRDGYKDVSVDINKIKDVAEGNRANAWMFDKFETSVAEVKFDKEASQKYSISDLSLNLTTTNLSKFQMMTKLARDLGVHADEAYELLNEAEREGSCQFVIDTMNKQASQIHIVGAPRFTEEFDSVTGIPVVSDQRFVLDTVGEQQFDERPHVGDALNPTTATGLPNATVVSVSPDQLRDLADSYNLPNVFEHGLVGTLADTFDANSLLDKYIPKLQEAVDSLGRIKFLIYWKPDDFQKSYGSDDMNNLEAQIDQSFNAIGDVTLQLLKKSDKPRLDQPKQDNSLD